MMEWLPVIISTPSHRGARLANAALAAAGGASQCERGGCPASPRARHRWSGSLRRTADRLDVVAVGVPDEGAVVARVVLGPHPGRVEDLGAHALGGVEEGVHSRPIGGGEGDVGLAESLPGVPWGD